MTEDEIWDKFTDLDDDGMADMAERATGGSLRVFLPKDFDDVMTDCHCTFSQIAEMMEDAVGNDNWVSMGESGAWIVYDDDAGTLKQDFDLMDMLGDWQDDIVNCIMNDEELLSELK